MLLLLLPSLASALSNCFEKIPNRTLIGSSIVIKEDISLARCQNACLEMAGERCRSVTYSEFDGRCELNKEDHESNARAFLPAIGWVDYYQRTCYDKPSVAVLRDDALFEDTCFETMNGKVLIGIVDQVIQDIDSVGDCRRACQKKKDTDIVCKSAAYYAKEKECIIASQSRHDSPDLFIDDDKSVYIENVCLGGGRKEEIKKIEPVVVSKPKKTKVVNTNDAMWGQGLETMGRIQTTTLKSVIWKNKPTHSLGKSASPAPEPSGYDFGVVGETSEDVAPTTTSTTTTATTTTTTTTRPTTKVQILEQSGYESNADGIVGAGSMDTIPSSTVKSAPTVDAKIIDSYAVETTPKSAGYGRRLRDDRIRTCFAEVRPISSIMEARVAKAYSLEQCTDICRLCWRCLRGKKCQSVAYDRSKELCALSLSPLVDGGEEDSSVVYHNRINC